LSKNCSRTPWGDRPFRSLRVAYKNAQFIRASVTTRIFIGFPRHGFGARHGCQGRQSFECSGERYFAQALFAAAFA
jgi:hypothetical protein